MLWVGEDSQYTASLLLCYVMSRSTDVNCGVYWSWGPHESSGKTSHSKAILKASQDCDGVDGDEEFG